MAIGKSIKNKHALRSQGGPGSTIEMPPEGYVLGGPSLMSEPQAQEQPTSPFGEVPEQLPEEVLQEMQPEQTEEIPDPVQEVAPSKPTPQDSFKSIREAKEKAERERDAYLAQMMEMQTKLKQAPVSSPELVPSQQEDTDLNIDDDALVEGKHLKKYAKEYNELKKRMDILQQQTSQVSVESKIKAAYPDFETVVSKDNVEMLNLQYPEIAASLKDTKDLYAKASAAYTVIKKFGIGQLAEESVMKQNDKAKAVINAQKPRPLTSISPQQGDSPLSKANAFANGLTPELQAQLLKEMKQSMKRA